jgi:hypothetical protein
MEDVKRSSYTGDSGSGCGFFSANFVWLGGQKGEWHRGKELLGVSVFVSLISFKSHFIPHICDHSLERSPFELICLSDPAPQSGAYPLLCSYYSNNYRKGTRKIFEKLAAVGPGFEEKWVTVLVYEFEGDECFNSIYMINSRRSGNTSWVRLV